jgi:hypothetical protein
MVWPHPSEAGPRPSICWPPLTTAERAAITAPPHALAVAMHIRPASRHLRHRLSPAAATRLDPLATSPATRPTGQLTRTRPHGLALPA